MGEVASGDVGRSATRAADAVVDALAPGEAPATPHGSAAPGPISPADAADLRRDRLLAALTLIGGVGLVVGVPFALRAGAEFFLPVTAALVIAVALVPLLEWMERRRVPSGLAAFVCLMAFLTLVNAALASIVVPATQWFAVLPDRIPQIQANLAPLIEIYSNLQRYVNDTITMVAAGPAATEAQAQVTQTPTSVLAYVSSAPTAAIHSFFAILVIFFFLAGWSSLRRHTITSRHSFGGAMQTARVIQNVVDATSAYIGTITLINVSLGLATAAALWAIGMPSPLMWGGIVAFLNYIPYLGPIFAALLLGLGGLMSFDSIWWALAPAAIQVVFHMIEANAITPMVLGRRLTINPLLILISLSFWGWVWGTLGALLAVPLLIIIQTIIAAAGKPDIAGFLFESGTLVGGRGDDADRAPRDAPPA